LSAFLARKFDGYPGLLVLTNPATDDQMDVNSVLPGDILTLIDSVPVPKSDEDWRAIIESRPNDQIKVTILRDCTVIDLISDGESLSGLDILPIQRK
jgi:hypothetical protein